MLFGLVVASSAAASPLAFDAPGEFHADGTGAHEATWALLVFKNGTAADLHASSVHDASLTNESEIAPARLQRDGYSFVPYPLEENNTEALPAPFQVDASFPRERSGSLFVIADHLELKLQSIRGILTTTDAGDGVGEFARWDDTVHNLYRIPGRDLGSSVAVVANPQEGQGGADFSLTVRDATYIEWYNAVTSCPSSQPCPGGGGPEITSVPAPPGYKLTSERHTYEVLQGHGIELQGHGTLDYVVYGSSALDLTVDGSVRLPLAAATGQGTDCQQCAAPDNQTFSATGNITLQGLHPGSNGGLQADIGGDIETARFDETPIDPASLFGVRGAAVGAAVLGGGLVVFKLLKLLWPALFTRQREDEALNNERRRSIYEFIVKHPGVNLREAVRGGGATLGAGRHHLTKLVQAGLVIERPHRNMLRFFPNDARFRRDWQETAVLSDPDYRVLHDWIQLRPGRAQHDILAAFAASRGWTRGTTRMRVERLLDEGLLQTRKQGRFKLYFPSRALVVTAEQPVMVA